MATVASSLASKLTAEAGSNERFDAAVAEMQNLSKEMLAAIASSYLGYERTYKSKPEALKAIRGRQKQDAIGASRDRRVSKIAV